MKNDKMTADELLKVVNDYANENLNLRLTNAKLLSEVERSRATIEELNKKEEEK